MGKEERFDIFVQFSFLDTFLEMSLVTYLSKICDMQ